MTRAAIASVLIALCALSTGASGQNGPEPTPTGAACPRGGQPLATDTVYGQWRLLTEGQAEARVELGPHPDYAGFRGTVTRGSSVAQLAGDIDDEGQLALDESEDGRTISAAWSLGVQPDSCGKEFKGTWQPNGDAAPRPVVMQLISPAR